jgi:formylglycine-generating enzyme required for sulfatase activity
LNYFARPGKSISENLVSVAKAVYEKTNGGQRPWKADDLLENFVLVAAAPAAPTTSIRESQTVAVRDSLIDKIVVFPGAAKPGETIRLKLVSNSNRVRWFAFFPTLTGGEPRKINGTWSREDDLFLDFHVPKKMRPSRYLAKIVVQSLDSMQESKTDVEFEVLDLATATLEDSTRRVTDASPLRELGGVKIEQHELVPSPSRNPESPKQLSKPVGVNESLIQTLGFVTIPRGAFLMGAKKPKNNEEELGQWYKDEIPVHKLQVSEFKIMKRELTNGDVKVLIDSAGVTGDYPAPVYRELRKSAAKAENEKDYPAHVSWLAAKAIAAMASQVTHKQVRLPNEAEWEYAARGGLSQKSFPWGDAADIVDEKSVEEIVNAITEKSDHSNVMKLYPVMSISPPNGYGLFDVAGNAWEWTSSVYLPYPYRADAQHERQETKKRDFRVIRGGGVAHETSDVRVSFRGYGDPSLGSESDEEEPSDSYGYGVRLVLDTGGEPPKPALASRNLKHFAATFRFFGLP